MIRNTHIKHLLDIHPVSDRLAVAQFKVGKRMRLNIISAYAPQAMLDSEVKDKFYAELQTLVEQYKHSGITLIA